MATLSSLLVQRGVASMRGVEDAIARQVISGGDLATNVLEVGAAREEDVTHLAAETAALAALAPGRIAPVDPGVLRLLPGDVAARHGIFPIEKRGGDLVVATSQPLSQNVEDDLGFLLNLNLRPMYALRVRIEQALAEHYGLAIERRYARLLAKLEGRTAIPETEPPGPRAPSQPPAGEAPAAPAAGAPTAPPPAAPGAVTGDVSEPSPAVMTPARPTLRGMPRVAAEETSRLPTFDDDEPPAIAKLPAALELSPLPPAAAPAASGKEGAQAPAPSIADGAPGPERAPGQAAAVPQAIAAWAKAADDRARAEARDRRHGRARRKGPFPVALAEEEMQSAVTTDAVLDVLFDFAQQYFEYAALFVVHGDIAEGRDAAGRGADRDRVAAIGLPLDLPSTLAAARDRRVPVLTDFAPDGLDAELLRDLGRAPPTEGAAPSPTAPSQRAAAVVIPIVVRGRAVALLFGDDAPAPVELSGIGDVIAFAALAGASIERIILRKKMGRSGTGTAVRGAPDAISSLAKSAARAVPAAQPARTPSPAGGVAPAAGVAPKGAVPAAGGVAPAAPGSRAGVAALARMFASPAPSAGAPASPGAAAAPAQPAPSTALGGLASTLADAVVDSLIPSKGKSAPAGVPAVMPADVPAAALIEPPAPAPVEPIGASSIEPPQGVPAIAGAPVIEGSDGVAAETPGAGESIAVALQTPSFGESVEVEVTFSAAPTGSVEEGPLATESSGGALTIALLVAEAMPAPEVVSGAPEVGEPAAEVGAPREPSSEESAPAAAIDEGAYALPDAALETVVPEAVAPAPQVDESGYALPDAALETVAPEGTVAPAPQVDEGAYALSDAAETVAVNAVAPAAETDIAGTFVTRMAEPQDPGEATGAPVEAAGPTSSRPAPDAASEQPPAETAGHTGWSPAPGPVPERDDVTGTGDTGWSSADSAAETTVIAASAPASDRPMSGEDVRSSAPVVVDIFADSNEGLTSAIARAAEAVRARDAELAQRAPRPAPAPAPAAAPPEETITDGFPAVAPEPAHLSPDLPSAMPFATPPPPAIDESMSGVPLDALLVRASRGADVENARAELSRRAERNLAPLLALFPGPLDQDRHRSTERLPTASQCGPLLQAFAHAGARGAATVAVLARHDDVDVRFWAAHLLGEIASPEAVDGLLSFLVDADPAVRRIALRSAGAILAASLPGRPLEAALGYLARDAHTPLRERLAAVDAMGQLRVGFFVPILIGLLSAIPEEVGESARRALLVVTRQDFGRDAGRWNDWWSKNEGRHRLEWLIDALMHDTQSIRRAAGDELKQLTKEYFGYYDDLPKRERERAQERYREWWEREGRGRFR